METGTDTMPLPPPDVVASTTATTEEGEDEDVGDRNSDQRCPYAAALHVDNDEDSSSMMSKSDDENHHLHEHADNNNKPPPIVVKDLSSVCPAFESGTCPFRDVKTSQEARDALLKVPPSHLQMPSFYGMVRNLHGIVGQQQQQQRRNDDDDEGGEDGDRPDGDGDDGKKKRNSSYSLPGGCPVKDVAEKVLRRRIDDDDDARTEDLVSFVAAMEDLSLSAVMARLAEEAEEQRRRTAAADDDFGGEDLAAVAAAAAEDFAAAAAAKDTNKSTSVTSADATEEQHRGATSVPGATPSASGAEPDDEMEPSGKKKKEKSLSYCLKTGTAVSHQDAEDVHFVKNFVAGKIPRELYRQLVAMLYHVYVAMETCLERYGPEHFASCHFPGELNRTEALREDLDFWFGDGKKEPDVSPATRDYVDRIQWIAQHKPLLLLSHAYTRYLGDLSGGRILARIAKRALSLDDEGLAFYEFRCIDSPKRFKDRYRAALDELELSQDDIQDLVAEANVAFCLNMRLFEELDVSAGVPGSRVRPLEQALAFAHPTDNDKKSEIDGQSNQCPFALPPPQAAPASTAPSAGGGAVKHVGGGACPWPFILMHDPKAGLRDWRTWAFVGTVLAWVWSQFVGGA